MSNAQRVFEDKFVTAGAADSGAPEQMDLIFDDGNSLASPARALQAKLSRELQPALRFEAKHPVLTSIAVFTAACAGTWIFGAVLYMQF